MRSRSSVTSFNNGRSPSWLAGAGDRRVARAGGAVPSRPRGRRDTAPSAERVRPQSSPCGPWRRRDLRPSVAQRRQQLLHFVERGGVPLHGDVKEPGVDVAVKTIQLAGDVAAGLDVERVLQFRRRWPARARWPRRAPRRRCARRRHGPRRRSAGLRRTTSARARRASATGLRFDDTLLRRVAGSLESPEPEILRNFELRTSNLEQPVLAAKARQRTALRVQPGHRQVGGGVLLLQRLPANGELVCRACRAGCRSTATATLIRSLALATRPPAWV